MGYSVRRECGAVLERIEFVCRQDTGSSNAWIDPDTGLSYFFEEERCDQTDDGVRGEVYFSGPTFLAYSRGHYRLDGTGALIDAPSVFVKLYNRAMQ